MVPSIFRPCLFHSAVFHFLSVAVILLALAGRRCRQCYPDHCRTVQATLYRSFECIHVSWKESPADGFQGFCFLRFIFHQPGPAECNGRTVLKGEAAVLGPTVGWHLVTADRQTSGCAAMASSLSPSGAQWKYHTVSLVHARDSGTPYAVPSGPGETYSYIRCLAHHFQCPCTVHFPAGFSHCSIFSNASLLPLP